jgi:hypothetical protein
MASGGRSSSAHNNRQSGGGDENNASLLFEREKYGSAVNPSWSMSNTKSRYDRIRQKARLQLGQSPSTITRAECDDPQSEKIKNSKSLIHLTSSSSTSNSVGGESGHLSGGENNNNHKSSDNLRPLSAAYTNYHSCSNIMKPLSVSSHSLNTHWYKPKQLQLPKSVSCGDGLKQHKTEQLTESLSTSTVIESSVSSRLQTRIETRNEQKTGMPVISKKGENFYCFVYTLSC